MRRPIFILFVWIQARRPDSQQTGDQGQGRENSIIIIIPGGEERRIWWSGADISHCCQAELDVMGSDVARITHLARVTYLLLHAVYADCMQWVHPAAIHAAVHWAEEKLSIYLQHLIPQHCNHAAVCSESLQMWEHNTLSLNFHLIISRPSKMNNSDVFLSNRDVIFLGLLPGSILQFCIHFKTLQRVRVHCIHAAADASKVFSI